MCPVTKLSENHITFIMYCINCANTAMVSLNTYQCFIELIDMYTYITSITCAIVV